MKKFLRLCFKTIELLWWPWATLGGFTFLIGGYLFVNPIMYNFSAIFGTELSRFWSNVIAASIFIVAYILSHIIALLFLVAIVVIVKLLIKRRERRH